MYVLDHILKAHYKEKKKNKILLIIITEIKSKVKKQSEVLKLFFFVSLFSRNIPFQIFLIFEFGFRSRSISSIRSVSCDLILCVFVFNRCFYAGGGEFFVAVSKMPATDAEYDLKVRLLVFRCVFSIRLSNLELH